MLLRSLAAVAAGAAAALALSRRPARRRPVPDAMAVALERQTREREQAQRTATALAEVGRRLAESLEFDRRSHVVAGAVLTLFRGRRSIFFRLDAGAGRLICVAGAGDGDVAAWLGQSLPLGEGLSGRVLAERRPLISPDVLADPGAVFPAWAHAHLLDAGCRAWLSVPLIAHGEALGTLAIGDTTGRVFGAEETELLSAFAAQAALMLKNARLFEEAERRRREAEAAGERLQLVSRRLIEVQELERRHLARELHDEFGQALTAVKINLQTLMAMEQGAPARARLEESIAILGRLLQQARDRSLDLRPSLLDDFGLAAALRWYVPRQAERSGLAAAVVTQIGDARLPPGIEVDCFRVAQEAVTNVVRHARARRLSVELHRDQGELCLSVVDDGAGFDVRAARARAASGDSLGVLGMEERVSLRRGRLHIDSAPGRGTRIEARFPLPSSA